MNPQIFGTSPYVPADFEASNTMCTRCFETQSSPGCTCTRRSKFLTHSLVIFNNTSADFIFISILKITKTLKELRILQLRSKKKQTLNDITKFTLPFIIAGTNLPTYEICRFLFFNIENL